MANTKKAILYSNPLLGIMNPKKNKHKEGGENHMAKSRGKIKTHRATLRGNAGNYYIPLKSRLFPEHAGKFVNWNPKDRKERKHRGSSMFVHQNPLSVDFLKTSSLLLVGVTGGAYLVQTLPNLLKRISWFENNPTITNIASVVIVGGVGVGLTFLKHSAAKTIGNALIVTPIAMYTLKEAGSYLPSIYLPAATSTAVAMANPAASTTTGTSGLEAISGMGNVRPIRSANLQSIS